MRERELATFIRDNLPVMPVPGIPEIRLHKASPTSGLWRLAEGDKNGLAAPYWAYYWAGGLALARYVLDNPGVVAGRRVLDLGAGSGLVAIAAAKAGARTVIAAEVDRHAVAVLALNMALNAVSLSVVHDDVMGNEPPEADVVLVGDLFYAPELSQRVTAFLDRCLNRGMHVLVGDPWRAHLPTSRLEELTRYVVAEGWRGTDVPSGVFTFVAR